MAHLALHLLGNKLELVGRHQRGIRYWYTRQLDYRLQKLGSIQFIHSKDNEGCWLW